MTQTHRESTTQQTAENSICDERNQSRRPQNKRQQDSTKMKNIELSIKASKENRDQTEPEKQQENNTDEARNTPRDEKTADQDRRDRLESAKRRKPGRRANKVGRQNVQNNRTSAKHTYNTREQAIMRRKRKQNTMTTEPRPKKRDMIEDEKPRIENDAQREEARRQEAKPITHVRHRTRHHRNT